MRVRLRGTTRTTVGTRARAMARVIIRRPEIVHIMLPAEATQACSAPRANPPVQQI